MKKMSRRILWILILIILFFVFLCGRISADFPVWGIFKKYAGTGKQSCGVVVRGWNSALDLAAF